MRFHQALAFLPTFDALAIAKASDEQGYDGVEVSDHMFFPADRQSRYTYSTRPDGAPSFEQWDSDTHWPDTWCFVSAMAAVTTNVRFMSGVYVAPARDLITVAKQVATAAVLSSGRVTFGVGVGWCREEFEATGQDFTTRGKRLDDMIPALRALWSEGWVEYHGAHYDIASMRMEPTPPSPIPIIGGGHSEAAFRRVATLCDGWVAAGAYTPDQARHYLTELNAARDKVGRREPFDIYLSLMARPDVDLFRQFEEEFGVTDFLCGPAAFARVNPADSPEAQLRFRIDESQRFADTVIAKAR